MALPPEPWWEGFFIGWERRTAPGAPGGPTQRVAASDYRGVKHTT